jgi:FkbM family methyltransferase
MSISSNIPAHTDLRLRMCAAVGRMARSLPSFRGKSRLGRSLASKLLLGRRSAWVPVELAGGEKLLLDPRGRTESAAFYHGKLDEDDLDFFRLCVAHNSAAMDIGANIGLVSIPLGRHLQSLEGRLFSIEPVANNAGRLRANLRLNGLERIVSVMECALGDNEGSMEIGREAGGGAETGNAALRPGAEAIGENLEWTTTRVRRLDNVADDFSLDRLDFIKIDVEGAELSVLKGGMKTIERFRPIIYGEFSSQGMPKFGGTFADVGTLFAPLGYRAMAFRNRLDLVDVNFEPGRGNAVLCPVEKARWILERCAKARKLEG